MAPRQRSNPTVTPKTERVEFRVTPPQAGRLNTASKSVGLTRADFLTRELSYLLDGDGRPHPFIVQVRLFFLQLHHEGAQQRAESLAAEIAHTRDLIQARHGTVLAIEIPHMLEHVLRLEELLGKANARVAELGEELDTLRGAPPRARVGTTRAAAFAGVPLVLGVSWGGVILTGIVVLALLAAASALIFWHVTRRRRASKPKKPVAQRLRRIALAAKAAAVDVEDAQLDADAEALTDKGRSLNVQEIVLEFWRDPAKLRHRIQTVLDVDGLDPLRIALEEGQFEWFNDEGQSVRIILLGATEEQWRLLPPNFQLGLLSSRSRRVMPQSLLRQASEPADPHAAGDSTVEVGVAPPPPLPAKKRGRPSKADLARRALERGDPGILPHQPPSTANGANGHHGTNANGATGAHPAAPAGGGES